MTSTMETEITALNKTIPNHEGQNFLTMVDPTESEPANIELVIRTWNI